MAAGYCRAANGQSVPKGKGIRFGNLRQQPEKYPMFVYFVSKLPWRENPWPTETAWGEIPVFADVFLVGDGVNNRS